MSVYNFEAKSIEGTQVGLRSYSGKVLLIVNVASRCGFTPQYEGLEKLYEKFKDQGLVVLGFPCNQFGAQEPAPESEIREFCQTTYGVTFPLFAKVDVNGPEAHPLYKFLQHEKPGILGTEAIKWNFTKFLIDQNGQPVKRYAPSDKPESIEAEISRLLAAAP